MRRNKLQQATIVMAVLGALLFCPESLLCAEDGPWVRITDSPSPSANVYLVSRWNPATGMRFRLTNTNTCQQVILTLHRDSSGLDLDPRESFPPSVLPGAQFSPEVLPPASRDPVAVTIKLRPETWAIYVNDRPAAIIPSPLSPPLAIEQDAATALPAGESDVYVQKVADFEFADAFLVPEDDENPLAAWQVESGSWTLHTAADTAVERETIKKDAAQRPIPERSPNFYSLEGTGTHAIITAGHDFYDAYTAGAATKVGPGERGIVFLYAGPSNYFAYTVQLPPGSHEAILAVRRVTSADDRVGRVLQAVAAPLTPGQWVKLKVRLFQNRVRCYLDETQVMDFATELTIGGRFGLYADAPDPARFDDVAAASNHDLDFMGVDLLRRYALHEEGRFLPHRRFFGLLGAPRLSEQLEPPPSRHDQWLVVGSPHHGPHVFAASFTSEDDESSVGLIAGYRAPDTAHYRFIRETSERDEMFRLERVAGGSIIKVERISFPLPRQGRPRDVRLLADATGRDVIRLYCNQRLVLVHHPGTDSAFNGASGFFVGGRTRTRITAPEYTFTRRNLYRNRFEKNQYFMADAFMRHWSSPEGEWIPYKETGTWHKGDFFGRFLVRMPCVPDSEVHLGVPEGDTNGTVVVRVSKDRIRLTDRTGEQEWASAATNDLVQKGSTNVPLYTLEYEDHWLWLTAEGRPLARHFLKTPLSGTRIRIAGFSTDNLRHSYVERFNVKDYLFTESLHEWTRNGGVWSVVNRFQCQPMWSHMNGESADGLAALWNKHVFQGDFCVEMYAGMRQGWYERCGDLNLTIMNDATTPGAGYTATCTGWDFDHSQRFTRLYRNGSVIAESDDYVAPRIREGNKRRGYNPLVAGGRDVHGGWYYIKLRRIGKRLQYYFDNELIFEADDETPLAMGSLGVWTYRNSMMVARVKVAAQEIRPRKVDVRPLDDRALAALQAPLAPPSARPHRSLTNRGVPLDCARPELWSIDDPIGRSLLTWHASPADGCPYFVVHNTLGGGDMFAALRLDPLPYAELAGWQMQIRRTPRAQFNIHYSIGKHDKDGKYQPLKRFFHRISGTDFSRGPLAMSGRTAVPAAQSGPDNWHAHGEWTPVTVWIETQGINGLGGPDQLLVRLEGIGTRQPSYVAQGLTGNGPGEAYAAKGITPVFYGKPQLALPEDATAPSSVALFQAGSTEPLRVSMGLPVIQDRLAHSADTGRIHRRLRLLFADRHTDFDLSWVSLPPAPDLRCEWSDSVPDAIELRTDADYPDRRFAWASAHCNGIPMTLQTTDTGARRGYLPQEPGLVRTATNTVVIAVLAADVAEDFRLAWSDAPLDGPPVLRGIKGCTPFFLGFGDRRLQAPLQADVARMELVHDDPIQGPSLRIANPGAAQRLDSTFAAALDLAKYPLFQFRYRASGMVHVTLNLADCGQVKVNEAHPAAVQTRLASDLQLDDEWHTWQGIVSDAAAERKLAPGNLLAGKVQLASLAPRDQTGLHTSWQIDDLVAGPAVARAGQLAFTPDYFDFTGSPVVHVAVGQGPLAFPDRPQEDTAALAWQPGPGGAPVTPDLGALQDGVCQLFVKASDPAGHESPVTSIPFLLDRKTDQTTRKLVDPQALDLNSSMLHLSVLTGGGAPLDTTNLKVKWNDEVVALGTAMGSTFRHSAEQDVLAFNWPYTFRHQLNTAPEGQTNKIVICGLADGAGNAIPDIVTPHAIDFAADTNAPTLLATLYPESILRYTAWDATGERVAGFKPASGTAISLVRKPPDEPCLEASSSKADIQIYLECAKPAWNLVDHPIVALRVRYDTAKTNVQETVNISLVGADRRYVIPLGPYKELARRKPRRPKVNRKLHKDETVLAPSTPMDISPGKWHAIILNIGGLVRDLLEKEHLGKPGNWRKDLKQNKAMQIRSLHLEVPKPTKETALRLQCLFIMRPWTSDDEIKLAAYDTSGVDGVTWDYEPAAFLRRATNMHVKPAALGAGFARAGWTVMRVPDRAGNLSLPLRIPFYRDEGSSAPTPVVE